jgi:hypothetical protein
MNAVAAAASASGLRGSAFTHSSLRFIASSAHFAAPFELFPS